MTEVEYNTIRENFKKLREEESGVYGVGARGSMTKFPFGNLSFNISFPCGPENVDSLVNWTL